MSFIYIYNITISSQQTLEDVIITNIFLLDNKSDSENFNNFPKR